MFSWLTLLFEKLSPQSCFFHNLFHFIRKVFKPLHRRKIHFKKKSAKIDVSISYGGNLMLWSFICAWILNCLKIALRVLTKLSAKHYPVTWSPTEAQTTPKNHKNISVFSVESTPACMCAFSSQSKQRNIYQDNVDYFLDHTADEIWAMPWQNIHGYAIYMPSLVRASSSFFFSKHPWVSEVVSLHLGTTIVVSRDASQKLKK